MSQDTERIRVGEETDGGEPVELPVIDVLAGRGFITGKSGSGKSNSASVVAEQLLEAGYGLLIVDIDGEYYGLKEEYELLHAGADEECDIRVSPEHAEKLASLALEENVPIILDVSSYLDPDDADEMLLAVARQLFAKAKKQKKPFLVLVEECHEYIPEGGGMSETGKMLIKIGKRGRKHGLGIVGMSQRPADVKKDFITQCDWMVWHRLTWDNDTRVVGRILGNDYADRVEELGDGEAFLDTDWTDDVRRVQFDRKRTFDAGATPGLEEFERPDLQSVSEDLVADLQQVSEERERHESELQTLEAELEEKEQRIEELEAELAEARDMSEMADRFAQALVENADAAPPARSPPEPEVAEAEEFVASDGRDGYPGSDPAPETAAGTNDAPEADGDSEADTAAAEDSAPDADAPAADDDDSAADPTSAGDTDPDEDAEPERELLPEEQRELHAYAVSDGGSPEEADESGERSVADAEEGDQEKHSGLKPVRTTSNTSDSDDDEPEAVSPSEESGSEPAVVDTETDEGTTPVGDSQPEEVRDAETVSDGSPEADDVDGTAPTPAESEATDASVTEPEEAAATAAEAGEADASGAEPHETDESVQEPPAGEATDDIAGATGAQAEEPGEPDAESTDPDETTTGDAEGAEEPESGTVDDERPFAQGTGDGDEVPESDAESAATAAEDELEAEPETWDEQASPGEASESATDTFEATGDWPTPDGERTAHRTDPGDPDPPTDPDRAAELEQQLAEEFGVTMESGSDLTGGSLGSSRPDSDSTEGGTSDTEPAADPDGDDSGTDDDTAAESEPEGEDAGGPVDPTADRGERLTELVEESELRDEESVVQVFVHGIEAFDDVTRGMLEHYRSVERSTPVDAHVAAGGSGERQYAYARNRTLRTAGLIEHDGGGRYRYRLPDLLAELYDGNVDEAKLSRTVSAVEKAAGLTEE